MNSCTSRRNRRTLVGRLVEGGELILIGAVVAGGLVLTAGQASAAAAEPAGESVPAPNRPGRRWLPVAVQPEFHAAQDGSRHPLLVGVLDDLERQVHDGEHLGDQLGVRGAAEVPEAQGDPVRRRLGCGRVLGSACAKSKTSPSRSAYSAVDRPRYDVMINEQVEQMTARAAKATWTNCSLRVIRGKSRERDEGLVLRERD